MKGIRPILATGLVLALLGAAVASADPTTTTTTAGTRRGHRRPGVAALHRAPAAGGRHVAQRRREVRALGDFAPMLALEPRTGAAKWRNQVTKADTWRSLCYVQAGYAPACPDPDGGHVLLASGLWGRDGVPGPSGTPSA